MAVAAISSFPLPVKADDPSPWQVKTSLILIDTKDPFAIDKPSGGAVYAGGNAELGISLGVEYRLSDLVGLEVGMAYAKSPEVTDTANDNNDELGEGPSFLPILVGANFHIVDTGTFDLYVGPRIGYVNFGDFDLDVDGQQRFYDVSGEFAWGAMAGFAYGFGDSSWSLVAEATYLDVDMKITERGTSNTVTSQFDPLMVNLGVAYRF